MRGWRYLPILGLLAAGCSTKTSAPVTCDNSGVRMVAFASDRDAFPGHSGIWLYDLDGQGFRLLRNLSSPTGIDSTPSLSLDGQLVAFTRTDSLDPAHTHVLVYDRATCAFAALGPTLDTGHEKDPAFTGDALRLAFARDTLAHWRIRLIRSDGTLVSLGHLGDGQPYDDWDPSPNINGSVIAFVSNRVTAQLPDGNPHVFVYDVAHDSLIATPGLDTLGVAARNVDPSITPDGHWLVFASDRGGGVGGFDVYRYDFATHVLQRLPALNSDQDDRNPSISPDGGVVVFESRRTGGGGKNDLWIYSIGSAAPYQTLGIASPADDRHPSLVLP
jgi:Tol biopolymer transport system component